MNFFRFDQAIGKKVTQFNSNFFMARILQTDLKANISCMYLEENGVIGYHQAVVPQLLLVVQGEGYVRNETEEYIRVQPGDAVFWEKDEWHETKTESGLMAIVIQSVELKPESFMENK